MSTEEQLIRASAALARNVPEAWSEFIEALHERASEANGALVASDITMLQVNQGRAQAYSVLFRTCQNAVQRLDEMEKKRGG